MHTYRCVSFFSRQITCSLHEREKKRGFVPFDRSNKSECMSDQDTFQTYIFTHTISKREEEEKSKEKENYGCSYVFILSHFMIRWSK